MDGVRHGRQRLEVQDEFGAAGRQLRRRDVGLGDGVAQVLEVLVEVVVAHSRGGCAGGVAVDGDGQVDGAGTRFALLLLVHRRAIGRVDGLDHPLHQVVGRVGLPHGVQVHVLVGHDERIVGRGLQALGVQLVLAVRNAADVLAIGIGGLALQEVGKVHGVGARGGRDQEDLGRAVLVAQAVLGLVGGVERCVLFRRDVLGAVVVPSRSRVVQARDDAAGVDGVVPGARPAHEQRRRRRADVVAVQGDLLVVVGADRLRALAVPRAARQHRVGDGVRVRREVHGQVHRGLVDEVVGVDVVLVELGMLLVLERVAVCVGVHDLRADYAFGVVDEGRGADGEAVGRARVQVVVAGGQRVLRVGGGGQRVELPACGLRGAGCGIGLHVHAVAELALLVGNLDGVELVLDALAVHCDVVNGVAVLQGREDEHDLLRAVADDAAGLADAHGLVVVEHRTRLGLFEAERRVDGHLGHAVLGERVHAVHRAVDGKLRARRALKLLGRYEGLLACTVDGEHVHGVGGVGVGLPNGVQRLGADQVGVVLARFDQLELMRLRREVVTAVFGPAAQRVAGEPDVVGRGRGHHRVGVVLLLAFPRGSLARCPGAAVGVERQVVVALRAVVQVQRQVAHGVAVAIERGFNRDLAAVGGRVDGRPVVVRDEVVPGDSDGIDDDPLAHEGGVRRVGFRSGLGMRERLGRGRVVVRAGDLPVLDGVVDLERLEDVHEHQASVAEDLAFGLQRVVVRGHARAGRVDFENGDYGAGIGKLVADRDLRGVGRGVGHGVGFARAVDDGSAVSRVVPRVFLAVLVGVEHLAEAQDLVLRVGVGHVVHAQHQVAVAGLVDRDGRERQRIGVIRPVRVAQADDVAFLERLRGVDGLGVHDLAQLGRELAVLALGQHELGALGAVDAPVLDFVR